MRYERMPIEVESPEEIGYNTIRYNLSESSITDQRLSDFGLVLPDIPLVYNEHRGSEMLRSLVVEGTPGLSAADVLITGGAAGALFIVSTALLSARDHLVVVRPNYATNLETPRAIACDISFLDLSFEQGFRLDIEALSALLRPETKLISITCPHNPTGVMLTEDELRQVVDLARKNGSVLVVDETYRDLSLDAALPLAASLGSHVISVSSLSKAYGVPGIRLGWLITSNPKLQELFLAAKEQISICGSVLHEWIGENILMHRSVFLDATLRKMHHRRRIVDRDDLAARAVRERAAGRVVALQVAGDPAAAVQPHDERQQARARHAACRRARARAGRRHPARRNRRRRRRARRPPAPRLPAARGRPRGSARRSAGPAAH